MKCKPERTGKNSLTDVVALIKKTMRYVDASADVSFSIAKDGAVTGFKLINTSPRPRHSEECSCPRDNMYDSSRTGWDPGCVVHGAGR